jgi:predicted Zn-dependent protease
MSRVAARALKRPILDSQPGDPPKLSRIVRHQRQAEAAGVSGNKDEKVVRSNHAALPFQVSAYAGVVQRCFVGKVQNLDVIQEGA